MKVGPLRVMTRAIESAGRKDYARRVKHAYTMYGTDDMMEEEDDLIESARADEARFRAFRCFFVIEAFSAVQKVRR